MFGSGNDGLGALRSFTKMVETVNAITSPMKQVRDAISLTTQFRGIELSKTQYKTIDRLANLTMTSDKIGRYLERTQSMPRFDKMLALQNSLPDISKTWAHQLNFTISAARLAQFSGHQAWAHLRVGLVDNEFQKALLRISMINETFTKSFIRKDSFEEATRIRKPKRSKLRDFSDIDKEDVDIVTDAFNKASARMETAVAETTHLHQRIDELTTVLREQIKSTDPKQIRRREFLSAALNQIISAFLSFVLATIMAGDQKQETERMHKEQVEQSNQIVTELRAIERELRKEGYRICVAGTFVRECPETNAKILCRIKADDVIVHVTNSSNNVIQSNPKWMQVIFITDENLVINGWVLRARFRKE